MLKVLKDRTRREVMALRNQSRARLYQLAALRPRRTEFYRRVQRLTADWFAPANPAPSGAVASPSPSGTDERTVPGTLDGQ